MTRDMELVRKILLALEAHPHGHAPDVLKIDGYDKETIEYHIYQMGEGDLLDVAKTTSMGSKSPSAIPLSITWKGHEFLDAARQPAIWERAKALAQKAGSTSFPVLMEALVRAAIEKL